jgi:2-iminobutanoate/2-iminopropanoate deaminase
MLRPAPIEVPSLPPNNPTYSQAVRLGGWIFVSGQLGVDPATGQLVAGGISQQTRQAIDNLAAILDAAGSGLDRVAKVSIFLTDFSMLSAMNAVYAARFLHRPAKTTVEIARLDKDALIEIEVIAAAGQA